MDQVSKLNREAEGQRQMQPGPVPTGGVTLVITEAPPHFAVPQAVPSRAAVGNGAAGAAWLSCGWIWASGARAAHLGPARGSGPSPSRAQEQAFCSPGGAAPCTLMPNQRYLYEQTVSLSVCPSKKKACSLGSSLSAWEFPFSTFLSGFAAAEGA